MGGKQWSAIEEAFFWTEIVSHSGKRVASDRANAEKTWNELAAVMQEKMGNNALRTYTGNSLCMGLPLPSQFFQIHSSGSNATTLYSGTLVQECSRAALFQTCPSPCSEVLGADA